MSEVAFIARETLRWSRGERDSPKNQAIITNDESEIRAPRALAPFESHNRVWPMADVVARGGIGRLR
eukprot:4995222-Prymnesium_polylepis.1